mgnify:CR=1 FL=1
MANLFSLEGKNAWITGASYGIGFNIAKAFVAAGIKNIIFNDINEAALQRGLDNYKEAGIENVKGYVCDVTKEDDVKALVEKIHQEVGQIDILVNNAGITNDKLALRMKLEDFTGVIEANLVSAFIGSREALKVMSKKRFGSVVNIASIVGEMGNAGQVNYSASKGGMIAMSKSFAKEGASRNVRFNCVTPGFIATDMTDKLSDEVRKNYEDNIPLKRFGNTEDIANAVAFLLSDYASYITGEVLKVNGGLYM